jgi:hypothetical protein
MPKTVDAVFFDMLHLSFCGGFLQVYYILRLVKNLTPGRKRVLVRIILFGGLQGRVGPEGLNKKFVEIVNILGMF